jgi:sugar-specific transcriptional regulator TrmB
MDELLDTLQDIGLTQYQSRAYVAAVDLDTERLSVLSDEADIPQQRIYDIIDDLEELGLVEVHEGESGKEAVAVPPEVGLEELKRQRVEQFESTFETAIDDLTERFTGVDRSKGFVTVVNHESSARRHVANAIDQAEWWLFLSLPAEWYREFQDDVRAAVERGVTVWALLQGDYQTVAQRQTYPDGMLVRHRPSADLVVAADRAYGVFRGVAAPAMSRPTLVTTDRSMVEMFQRYSEQFWTASQLVRSQHTYPRRYLTPWRSINDHIEALDDGEPLEVSVEGHDTETGHMGSWEGPVVDYEIAPEMETNYSVVLPEVARLVVETGDSRVTIGGWDATLEDVAAHGIEFRRP